MKTNSQIKGSMTKHRYKNFLKERNKERETEEKKIKDFCKFIFDKNKGVISISIIATSKKSKNGFHKDRLGNKLNGFQITRRDLTSIANSKENANKEKQ